MGALTTSPLPALGRRLLREPPRPTRIRESPRARWYVVGALFVGAFMGQLDVSIVTLALPHIGASLDVGRGAVSWVSLSYLLVLACTLIPVGRLADRFGRKLLYTQGFVVFTAGSLLCGLAPSLGWLIAARVLQALGAALLQANSVALITQSLPSRSLARGLGVQGAAQALGLALGPAVGGLLIAIGGWRLVFLINLPAGAVGLVLGWLLLPRSRSRREHGGSDRLGALLLATATAGVLAYLSLASRSGYGDGPLLALLATGIVASLLFVAHEQRAPEPLLDLSILRRPAMSVGLSSGLLSFLILFGALYVVPYYLAARHTGAAAAGLQLTVLPVAIGVSAVLAGRLVTRVGTRALTGGGMAVTGVGLLLIATTHGIGGLLAGLALAGIGLGAFTPANNASIMAAAPAGHAGLVGGVLNMTRGAGTALGVAVASALYLGAAGFHKAGGLEIAAAGQGLTLVMATLGCAALLLAAGLLLTPTRSCPEACS
jgi:EmrB/QacA subfamily drug resistance transporter